VLYILHGENLASIRNFILEVQKKNDVTTRHEFAIEQTSPAEISDIISAIDMFGGMPLISIDISKMGRMKVDEYIGVVGGAPKDMLVVIFAAKNLPKTNAFIKNAPDLGAQVKRFEPTISANVFQLVDYAFNGNRRASYKALQKLLLLGEDPIYIFSMLLYGLRNITYAKFDSPAINKVPPFAKSKAQRQARVFGTSQLGFLYARFYEWDVGVKSGLVNPEMLSTLALESILHFSTA